MTTIEFDLFSEVSLNSDNDDDYFSDSDSDVYFIRRTRYLYNLRLPPLEPVDFENYIRDNCQNKIKILQRSTFHQIKKPIIIFFNHFQEKCAYHTKYLDRFSEIALKYGEQIEFIAADMLDIDVMNSKWHPIDHFSNLVSPERETILTYAIDEQKRIYQLYCYEHTLEVLMGLCEKLLQGVLFISQPLSLSDNSKLVKICVHNNYRELVSNAKRNILLIVGTEDYSEINQLYEPNYEKVAEQLVKDQVDVVYINGEKNYIPFELNVFCFPTLLYIPADNKNNFVDFLQGPRNEENIIKCLRQYLKDPESYLNKLNKETRKYNYKPLNIPSDFCLDFTELPRYLENNCYKVEVFEREKLLKSKRCNVIAFMNFPSGKCLTDHLSWIDKIYQVTTNMTSCCYYIADLKDIDIINPKWKPQDFISIHDPKPKVFGIDVKQNKFALNDFKTAASLFYFAYKLCSGELLYSERWPHTYDGKLVKTSIYNSKSQNTDTFLQQLDEIAKEFKDCRLKIIKIDARLNYIPLEMDDISYPVLYFIPRKDKTKHLRFLGADGVKEEIVDFIKRNME
ncbi:uncharacterized protein ACRADG_005820 [Cochliomyia hominivorax]